MAARSGQDVVVRMSAAAIAAVTVALLGWAGPTFAAAQLDLATVSASTESTNDGGSDGCFSDFTVSETCTASSSGSADGASGSASARAEATLGYDGGDLVSISTVGRARGQATATEEDSAYGEASAQTFVSFDVLSPTLVRVSGSLDTLNNRDTACSRVGIAGPGTSLDVRAPGSGCGVDKVAGTVDESVLLQPGAYQFHAEVDGGPFVQEGGGTRSSRGRFDIDVELLTCDNEFTAGDDVIDGTPGNDVLCGGPGDDTIDGKGGRDKIFGGGGSDLLIGGDGNDHLDGGADDDVLDGGTGNDVLLGGGGDDTILGGAQADTVRGGAGDDHIDGAGGPDELFGEQGVDTIGGGPGDDLIDGGAGADAAPGLHGGPGDDIITGGPGDDIITGGPGEDVLKGEAGRDKLRGGAHDDVLIGGGDRDVHNGGGGRDILRAKDGRKDRVLGGPGRDRGRVDRVDEVVGVEVIQ